MSLEMGAAQLDLAAANISARLPYRHGPSCDGLRPSVILSIPYPDPRVQSFGSIDGSGRSLNFTLVVDRISACRWYGGLGIHPRRPSAPSAPPSHPPSRPSAAQTGSQRASGTVGGLGIHPLRPIRPPAPSPLSPRSPGERRPQCSTDRSDSAPHHIRLASDRPGSAVSRACSGTSIRFVKTAYDSWNAKGFKQVQLTGFYWYLEELLVDPPAQPRLFSDDLLIKSVAQAIKATDPGLLFAWIPYYKGPGTPWLDQWEDLGFDYVTLQPNYAFNNVTAADRFGVVRELAVKNRLGVEIEIPNGVRNALCVVGCSRCDWCCR